MNSDTVWAEALGHAPRMYDAAPQNFRMVSAHIKTDRAAVGLLYSGRVSTYAGCWSKQARNRSFTDVLSAATGPLRSTQNSTRPLVGSSTPERPLLAKQIVQGTHHRQRSQRRARAIIRRCADLHKSLPYLAFK